MKDKKIWIFNHYATDMFFNKGGRHYWFAKELMRKGNQVTIFCANTCHNRDNTVSVDGFFSEKEIEGIKFIFIPVKTYNGNGIDRIFNMVDFYKKLGKTAKNIAEIEKPDFILASSVHPLTMVRGLKLSKNFKIPCVCEVRDLWPEAILKYKNISKNSIFAKILMYGEYKIYKKCDALIFTKEGDIDYLREQKWTYDTGGKVDEKKIFYINNGINLIEYNELKNKEYYDEDLESDKFKIIYTGSLRPVNDLIKIIDVAEIIKNKKEIIILIYGDGNQKNELERLIKSKKLENIKIKGAVSKNKIPFVLSKSNCNLLHYSGNLYDWSRGNSSNKLFEYLASGKPVISTVKMGYSIIDRNNCGLETPDNSAESIAKTIIEISEASSEELFVLGNNARDASKEFDYGLLTNKLVNVFNFSEIRMIENE